MFVYCPYCKEKSDPIKGYFSLCKHIIACFKTDEYDNRYVINREHPFVLPKLSSIIEREGLPFKLLQDYLKNIINDATVTKHINKESINGSLIIEDLEHNEEILDSEKIIGSYDYDIYYSNDIELIYNNLVNYIIDLSFKPIVSDLRTQYLLYRLAFENRMIDLEKKIRPIFWLSDHWELNFDFWKLPVKLLRDGLR
jgi:hypothetical protein